MLNKRGLKSLGIILPVAVITPASYFIYQNIPSQKRKIIPIKNNVYFNKNVKNSFLETFFSQKIHKNFVDLENLNSQNKNDFTSTTFINNLKESIYSQTKSAFLHTNITKEDVISFFNFNTTSKLNNSMSRYISSHKTTLLYQVTTLKIPFLISDSFLRVQVIHQQNLETASAKIKAQIKNFLIYDINQAGNFLDPLLLKKALDDTKETNEIKTPADKEKILNQIVDLFIANRKKVIVTLNHFLNIDFQTTKGHNIYNLEVKINKNTLRAALRKSVLDFDFSKIFSKSPKGKYSFSDLKLSFDKTKVNKIFYLTLSDIKNNSFSFYVPVNDSLTVKKTLDYNAIEKAVKSHFSDFYKSDKTISKINITNPERYIIYKNLLLKYRNVLINFLVQKYQILQQPVLLFDLYFTINITNEDGTITPFKIFTNSSDQEIEQITKQIISSEGLISKNKESLYETFDQLILNQQKGHKKQTLEWDIKFNFLIKNVDVKKIVLFDLKKIEIIKSNLVILATNQYEKDKNAFVYKNKVDNKYYIFDTDSPDGKAFEIGGSDIVKVSNFSYTSRSQYGFYFIDSKGEQKILFKQPTTNS